MGRPTGKSYERFLQFMPEDFVRNVRVESGKCWMWTGAKNPRGYGIYRGKGAHRFMYRTTFGDPGKSFVCHRCDVPGCVNPAHLFKGDARDNTWDMCNKHRGLGQASKAKWAREAAETGVGTLK
jgi:hypothetical protein